MSHVLCEPNQYLLIYISRYINNKYCNVTLIFDMWLCLQSVCSGESCTSTINDGGFNTEGDGNGVKILNKVEVENENNSNENGDKKPAKEPQGGNTQGTESKYETIKHHIEGTEGYDKKSEGGQENTHKLQQGGEDEGSKVILETIKT